MHTWMQYSGRSYRVQPALPAEFYQYSPGVNTEKRDSESAGHVPCIEFSWQKHADPWLSEIITMLEEGLGTEHVDQRTHCHVMSIEDYEAFSTAHPRTIKWNSIWRGLKRRGYTLTQEAKASKKRVFTTSLPVASFGTVLNKRIRREEEDEKEENESYSSSSFDDVLHVVLDSLPETLSPVHDEDDDDEDKSVLSPEKSGARGLASLGTDITSM